MSNIINNHKIRWCLNGNTKGDIALNDAVDEFNRVIDEKSVPTVHDIQYVSFGEYNIEKLKNERMIVSDITRNNSDFYDSKLTHFKLTSEIKSGCYIYWCR